MLLSWPGSCQHWAWCSQPVINASVVAGVVPALSVMLPARNKCFLLPLSAPLLFSSIIWYAVLFTMYIFWQSWLTRESPDLREFRDISQFMRNILISFLILNIFSSKCIIWCVIFPLIILLTFHHYWSYWYNYPIYGEFELIVLWLSILLRLEWNNIGIAEINITKGLVGSWFLSSINKFIRAFPFSPLE